MQPSSTSQLNVRIPRELAARVRMHATLVGRPVQELVAEALDKTVPLYKPQVKGK